MAYRKIGSFVNQISEKNIDGKYSEVLGVAIDKEFMPSVANIIGTDLKKYNVIRKNRFAFNPMHVGRDKKLPIALYRKETPALVSPAYTMLEITDPEIDAEYLMLIFKTEVFDHLCWFYTDASVRGGLTWENFSNIDINIPSLEEQRIFVKQYNTISKRIEILNLINNDLQKMSDAIYFDSLTKQECLRKCRVREIAECILGGTPSRDKKEYWNGTINWINSGEINKFRIFKPSELITEIGLKKSSTTLLPKDTTVLAITGATLGQVSRLEIDSCANQSVIGIVPKNKKYNNYIYLTMINNIDRLILNQTGGAQQHINKNDVESFEIDVPNEEMIDSLEERFRPIFSNISSNCLEIEILLELRNVMLLEITK